MLEFKISAKLPRSAGEGKIFYTVLMFDNYSTINVILSKIQANLVCNGVVGQNGRRVMTVSVSLNLISLLNYNVDLSNALVERSQV